MPITFPVIPAQAGIQTDARLRVENLILAVRS